MLWLGLLVEGLCAYINTLCIGFMYGDRTDPPSIANLIAVLLNLLVLKLYFLALMHFLKYLHLTCKYLYAGLSIHSRLHSYCVWF